jgi:hypothetical protein
MTFTISKRAGRFSTHLRAHDPAAPDDFARLGVHGEALQPGLAELRNATTV